MDNKQKFESFLESLKGNGQDVLIESVKQGFQVCFESKIYSVADAFKNSQNYEEKYSIIREYLSDEHGLDFSSVIKNAYELFGPESKNYIINFVKNEHYFPEDDIYEKSWFDEQSKTPFI